MKIIQIGLLVLAVAVLGIVYSGIQTSKTDDRNNGDTSIVKEKQKINENNPENVKSSQTAGEKDKKPEDAKPVNTTIKNELPFKEDLEKRALLAKKLESINQYPPEEKDKIIWQAIHEVYKDDFEKLSPEKRQEFENKLKTVIAK